MATPIINPSTLSEEQREAIRAKYNSLLQDAANADKMKLSKIKTADRTKYTLQGIAMGGVQCLFDVFGSEFFQQKGE